jgi:Ribonuclease G/E
VRVGLGTRRRNSCEIIANPEVVEYLVNERREYLLDLEGEFQKKIDVKTDATFSPDQFEIRYL